MVSEILVCWKGVDDSSTFLSVVRIDVDGPGVNWLEVVDLSPSVFVISGDVTLTVTLSIEQLVNTFLENIYNIASI